MQLKQYFSLNNLLLVPILENIMNAAFTTNASHNMSHVNLTL